MDSQKQQIVERIKQANNILVTVSANPSVDQLASCMALALALNKLKKHATAVFSGLVPSAIEFLQPEKTLERNTDSLRDFIIALDKSKADKLRYKIEDKVVKIFITPYKTSISQKDLQFSEGDFNVDVVLALGVHRQADLDQAITAHGRILHDAVVVSVNTKPNSELGSLNLLDTQASSLSEITVELLDLLDKRLIDNQIATALLTGIVAETDRFRNDRTSPRTMSISAELLAAGANQQLVAAKLETPPPPPPRPIYNPPGQSDTPMPSSKTDDGTLEIKHDEDNKLPDTSEPEESKDESTLHLPKAPQIHIDEEGEVHENGDDASKKLDEMPPPPRHTEGPHLVLQPPTFDSQLTATSVPPRFPSEDALTLPQVEESGPLLNREPLQTPSVARPITPPDSRSATRRARTANRPPSLTGPFTPPAPPPMGPSPTEPHEPPLIAEESISSLERDVDSPHLDYIEPPIPQYPSSSPPATPSVPAPSPLPPPSSSPLAPLPPSLPAAPIPPPTGGPAPVAPPDNSSVDSARDAVSKALNGDPNASLEPVQSLNAQDLGAPLHDDSGGSSNPVAGGLPPSYGGNSDARDDQDSGFPKPPPVPPPMIPPPPPAS